MSTLSLDPTATDPREVAHIVPERFYVRYVSDEKNPGVTQSVEMVLFAKKGQHIMTGQKTPMRITQARKDKQIWAVIEPYYEAWKKGQETPVDGTPLGAWPGLAPEQAERLRMMRVRSVEDVAAMTDADVDNFGMGGLLLRQNARAFVEMKKDKTVIQAEVSKQMEGMQAKIDELTAKLAATSSEPPAASEATTQTRRKRRTKAEMEAARAGANEAA